MRTLLVGPTLTVVVPEPAGLGVLVPLLARLLLPTRGVDFEPGVVELLKVEEEPEGVLGKLDKGGEDEEFETAPPKTIDDARPDMSP